jgi:hypothetical protein
MDIYLDIYGTLIASASSIADREALLNYLLDNFAGRIHWLTSYSEPRIREVLAREYNEELLERLINSVKYQPYNYHKTDGIDFTKKFIWLDDNLTEADYYTLKEYGALDNQIHIDPHDSYAISNALKLIRSIHRS